MKGRWQEKAWVYGNTYLNGLAFYFFVGVGSGL
jgi:hypothetical protein